MSIEKSLYLLKSLAEKNNLNEPFIVGGIPRNDLLKGVHEIHDIDITTGDVGVHTLAKEFAHDIGKTPKHHNNHYSVTHNDVRFDFSKNFKYPNIETLLKVKGMDNPTELEKETYSRDFTINTLLKKIDADEIIDLTGRGKQDIHNLVLECPLDCKESFKYSPDRILRAFYFKAKYGFEFSVNVDAALSSAPELVKNINPRHAKEMINKIVREDNEIIEDLSKYGILSYIPITKYLTKILLQRNQLLSVMDNQANDHIPLFFRSNMDYGERSQASDVADRHDILSSFENQELLKGKGTSLSVLNKESAIRGTGVRECPFGLPVLGGCKNAGSLVKNMTLLEDLPTKEKAKFRKANQRVFVFSQQGERCVFADKITESKDVVNCDWGDNGAGLQDFPMRPNPYYQRPFQGLTGGGGLYSYPVSGYSDGMYSSTAFAGEFSAYASGKDVTVSRHTLKVLDVLPSDEE